jgi:adenine-specific DNA-methyltransferase
MLHWVGKKPLARVTAFPAQAIEAFDPLGESTGPAATAGGRFYHGDCKEVLAHLLANGHRGKINLVYIDPPFDSGADYVRKVSLRGKSALAKLDAEAYSLGEQIQYSDIWANDTYLQFMFERLILLKELMAEDASIWLHCDPTRGHYLKCMMDEIFGPDNFVNQVVWKRSDAHNDASQGATHLGTIHDMILIFRKSPDQKWNTVYQPLKQETVDKWYRNVEEGTGRRYNKADITGPGGPIKGNPVYEWKGVTKAWRFSKARMEQLDKENRIFYSESGMPYLKRYLDESKGVPIQDWWDDIQMVRGIQRRDESAYPTEKPEQLLERVMAITTNPNDLVLDCFMGSGTTCAVAQKLGRRWIGCDINKGALQTAGKRLQGIIAGQIEASKAKAANEAGQLFATESPADAPPSPAALHFTMHRVNDYDLQIQHNEAVALACEHIGVERTKRDAYFEGVQGKRLVKIIPFNHPLSPADLEQLRDELKARKNEERDILIVCLGKELSADTWLAEWNRLRKRGDVPNKIEVIELRTDARYGKFIAHQPAAAKVTIRRDKDELAIDIHDFLSPTIVERLSAQAGVITPEIKDWRAMVDCILIDTKHDGHIFHIHHADIPAKKTDLVTGSYRLPAPPPGTTIAVKIIDMLGEEVVVREGV